MLACQALDSDEIKEQTTTETKGISKQMIDKMVKIVSSHRAALDFDKGYLNNIVTDEGFNLVGELNSESKNLSRTKKRKRQETISFPAALPRPSVALREQPGDVEGVEDVLEAEA